MGKKALVISGGGCKGAFAVGVLKYIFEIFPELKFDIICGTSTGSLMIPSIAVGNIPHLEDMYTNVITPQIVKKRELLIAAKDGYLFNADPLGSIIESEVNDEAFRLIQESGTSYYIAAVCLQTGKVTIFGNEEINSGDDTYDFYKIYTNSEMIEAIKASSYQPVFMKPVKITRNGITRQYSDGGMREYLPLRAAIDAGADKIMSIVHFSKNELGQSKMYTDLMSVLFRTMELFSEDVNTNDIIIAKQMAPDKVLEPIYPEYMLAENGLEFNKAEMTKNMEHGYKQAENWFEIYGDTFKDEFA